MKATEGLEVNLRRFESLDDRVARVVRPYNGVRRGQHVYAMADPIAP
jgi:hypothetical protein